MAEALRPEIMPAGGEDARSALDLVSAGATLMRIENETMMAVAVQRPRDERRILKAALDELDIVPALATRCFYSIPYVENKGRDNERTVYVSGASINSARNLLRRWGNASTAALIESEDDEKVVLAGVFVDMETNVRFKRPFAVTKWQHRRGGGAYRLSNERLMMAIQAGASKAERNAILAGLPDWLVQSYYDKARAIAAKDAKDGGTVSKITTTFLAFGVTREMLERLIGKHLDKLDENALVHLRGLANALRDGEKDVDEVFGVGTPSGDGPKPPASVDEVLKAGAAATAGTEAEGSKPAAATAAPTAPDPAPTASAAPAEPADAGEKKQGTWDFLDGGAS